MQLVIYSTSSSSTCSMMRIIRARFCHFAPSRLNLRHIPAQKPTLRTNWTAKHNFKLCALTTRMLRTFVILVTLVAFTSAFVTPQQRLFSIRAVDGSSFSDRGLKHVDRAAWDTTCALHAKKGAKAEPEKKEIDWVKIAGLFLFPGNPYAWFVYFFAFIIIAGSFPGN